MSILSGQLIVRNPICLLTNRDTPTNKYAWQNKIAGIFSPIFLLSPIYIYISARSAHQQTVAPVLAAERRPVYLRLIYQVSSK